MISWTFMQLGLPNSAAIIALALLPLVALFAGPTTGVRSGHEQAVRVEPVVIGGALLAARR